MVGGRSDLRWPVHRPVLIGSHNWTLVQRGGGIPAVLEFQAAIALIFSKMGKRRISHVALLLPLLSLSANATSDLPRPRGVGPECTLCLPELRRRC
jgi:hypothetical protein